MADEGEQENRAATKSELNTREDGASTSAITPQENPEPSVPAANVPEIKIPEITVAEEDSDSSSNDAPRVEASLTHPGLNRAIEPATTPNEATATEWRTYINGSTLYLALIGVWHICSLFLMFCLGQQLIEYTIPIITQLALNDSQAELFIPKAYHAERLNVVPTKTTECEGPIKECELVLLKDERVNGELIYNFVIAPDGHVFEHLGWDQLSPISKGEPTLVVGLIGQEENEEATQEQVDQLTILGIKSELLLYLDEMKIYFKRLMLLPMDVFKMVKKWMNWTSPPAAPMNKV